MKLFQLALGPMQNWIYVIACRLTRAAAVIDPGWEANRILEIIRDNDFALKYILNTHSHYDHTQENQVLKNKTRAQIVIGELEPDLHIPADILVKDGQDLILGNLKIKVITTPGHTPGGVCYLVGDALFTGDTLFAGGECGRTDLPGGSDEEMSRSLAKLSRLPDNTRIYSGHNYGNCEYTLMRDERQINPYMPK